METVIAEYIWLDQTNNIRSKIRILRGGEHPPRWNFDGSSTGQASTQTSEMVLEPVQVYPHPFFDTGVIVLCEVYSLLDSGKLHPHISNIRNKYSKLFIDMADHQPWYGIEQEYYILERGESKPLGLTPNRHSQGKYYCGNNPDLMPGRRFAEAHMQACLQAGLMVSGINAEVGPSQWEYQIGPVLGIEAADQLVVSRYLLQRIAERMNVDISLHPKPLGEDLPGSGCHTNFSTATMREEGGLAEIERVLENLKKSHPEYIKLCGEDTPKRLTGNHETAMIQTFSWAVAGRDVSVRIPKDTALSGCGYFEDRRPSANMDPYVICGEILKAV